MAVYTYTGNIEPHDQTQVITILERGLVVHIGESADFTSQEVVNLRQWGHVLEEGELGPIQLPIQGGPEEVVHHRGEFSPDTHYQANDLISEGGSWYLAKVDFTSGGSFDPDDWDVIGGGGGATDGLVYKGAIDASANPNYPAADTGDVYKISVAGKIGGGSGASVEVGDTAICNVDGSSAGTQAAVGANWTILQVNLVIDTDSTMASNSDARVPSQKAVKTRLDSVESTHGVLAPAPTGDADTDTAALLAAIALTISRHGVDGAPVILRPSGTAYKLAASGHLVFPPAGRLLGAGWGGRDASGAPPFVDFFASKIDASLVVSGAALDFSSGGAGQGPENLYLKGPAYDAVNASRVGGAVGIKWGTGCLTPVARNVFISGFTNQVVPGGAAGGLLDNVIGYSFGTHGFAGVNSENWMIRGMFSNGGGAPSTVEATHRPCPFLFDGCAVILVEHTEFDEGSGVGNVKIVGTSSDIELRAQRFYSNNYTNVVGILVGDGTNPVARTKIKVGKMQPYQHLTDASTRAIVVSAGAVDTVIEDTDTVTADDGTLGWYTTDIVDGGTRTRFRNVNGQSSLRDKNGAPIAADFNGLPSGIAAGAILDRVAGKVCWRLADGVVYGATLGAITPLAPVNTVAPVISGSGVSGATLTSTLGTWTQEPTSYTRQWKRGASNISGATGATYQVQVADEGTTVTCVVTATNPTGSTSQASNGIAIAAPFDPSSLSPVLWLKPESLAGLADGDPISGWTNSGSGGTMTQGTAGAKPTKQTANGYALARFDGGDYLISSASTTYKAFFVVAKYSGGAVWAGNYQGLICPASGANVVLLGGAGGVNTFYDEPSITTNYYKANTLMAENAMVGPMNAYAAMLITKATDWTLTVHVGKDGTGGAFWPGDVQEVIGLPAVPDSTQRANLFAYATARYGTP